MTLPFTQIILHGSAAGIMAYGFQNLNRTMLDALIKNQYGGHSQFLTIQGLFAAFITMVVALLVDLFPSVKAFHAIKRAIFLVSMPVAVVISSIYWSLILFFPHLILRAIPGSSEPSSSSEAPPLAHVPLDIDLALHAVPAISLFLDFFFFQKSFSANAARYGAPLAAVACATWYGFWVERCAKYNGVFPYPFLTENTFEVRLGIYAGATLIALISFYLLNALHKLIRRN